MKKLISNTFDKRWILPVFSIAIISVLCLLNSCKIYPKPQTLQEFYANKYESHAEVQKIIGLDLPKFRVIESKNTHLNSFDFEFGVHTKIEFEKALSNSFFIRLDSICNLPYPKDIDVNSSYFYIGLESVDRCWSKNGDEYNYHRNTDFGEKFLHSKDAYYYFSIKKGSKTAELKYGNY